MRASSDSQSTSTFLAFEGDAGSDAGQPKIDVK
jgi:hypothetical protein